MTVEASATEAFPSFMEKFFPSAPKQVLMKETLKMIHQEWALLEARDVVWCPKEDQHHREQIVHEAFMKLYEKFSTLDPNLPEKGLRAWIRAVLRSTHIDVMRPQKRKQELNILQWPQRPDSVAPRVFCNERAEIASKMMKQLPREQRECLQLFHLHGKSYQEIEEATGLTFNQVRHAVRAGRKTLAQLIAQLES